MTPKCPYCRQDARLLGWEEPGYPYPENWGPAWKCAPCDAYVRCYRGTTKPLGTLADAETRHWRSLAHRAVDPFWQGVQMSRSAVYRWMAQVLGVEEAHIGELDPAGCQRVIAAVEHSRLADPFSQLLNDAPGAVA